MCKFESKIMLTNMILGSLQADVTRASCMLLNTTAIKEKFDWMTYKFTQMFKRRAFLHNYTGIGKGFSKNYFRIVLLIILIRIKGKSYKRNG